MEKQLARHTTNSPQDTNDAPTSHNVQLSPLTELFYRFPITPDRLTNQPLPDCKNFISLSTKCDSSGDTYNDEMVQKYLTYLQGKKIPAAIDGLDVNCPSDITMPDEGRLSIRNIQLEGTCGVRSSNDEKELGLKRHHGEQELVEESSMQENGIKRLKKGAYRENTAVLRNWLDTHRSNPYPTKDERDMLAVLTGLSQQQVSTWFANARRRLKKQNPLIRKTNSLPATATVDMTRLLNWTQEQLRVINWFNFFTQFYHRASGGSPSEQTEGLSADFKPSTALPAPSDSHQIFGSPPEQEVARRSNSPERGTGRRSEDSGIHKETTDAPIWSVAKIALSSPRSGTGQSFRLEPSATVDNLQRRALENVNL
ncbi:unnamed protein product [Dibothriocephalus latus]|uniref:Homeobox domain-containing protein n=1 Tax=Dibothriocephalus latus TaxID=60516 RepID=A0A3P6T212_DIBLA|nr:unnamed protein product [Dibothriocephalus latus]